MVVEQQNLLHRICFSFCWFFLVTQQNDAYVCVFVYLLIIKQVTNKKYRLSMYNAENPTPVYVYSNPSCSNTTGMDTVRVCYIVHPIRRSRCFVFDLPLKLRSSQIVKTKAYSYAFYIYVSYPPMPFWGLSANIDFANIYIFYQLTIRKHLIFNRNIQIANCKYFISHTQAKWVT